MIKFLKETLIYGDVSKLCKGLTKNINFKSIILGLFLVKYKITKNFYFLGLQDYKSFQTI
jgi:hypothetical protein